MAQVPAHSPVVAELGSYRSFALSLLALFALAVMGAAGYAAYQDRQGLLDQALQRAQGNALVFEDQITQTLQLVDNTVRTLPDLGVIAMVEARADQANALLESLQHSQPAMRSFSLLDAQGQVLASSQRGNVGQQVDLRDFLPADPGRGAFSVLRIGSTWVGRDIATGHPDTPQLPSVAGDPTFVPLLMRITQDDKTVWALVALNPDDLLGRTDRYSQAQSDRFDLVRLDGRTLISSVEDPAHPAFLSEALLKRIQQEELGVDIGATLLAFRSSQSYPFFVSVQVDPDKALAIWRERSVQILPVIALALMAVMGLVFWLMARLQRGARAALARFFGSRRRWSRCPAAS
jgi:hypothetical protein